MLRILSEEERKQMDKEMVEWVKRSLKKDEGTHLYNILLQLKYLFEEVNDDKNSKKRRAG